MKKNVYGVFAVAGGYSAAVIGAGFASGQEIVSFFVRFGRYGLIGIIAACLVFALFASVLLSFCVENKIRSYSAFLETIFKSTISARIAEGTVFLCAAASMCVMTACAGETVKILYGMPVIAGSAAFAAVCGAIFLMKARGIMRINSALGIVIVVGIIFSCLFILRYREHQTFSVQPQAVTSGIMYAGYNIIGTGALLTGMSRFLQSKGDARLAAAVSGTVLFILITLIWGVLSIYYGKISLGEIPMLTMTFRQNSLIGNFYGVMLAAAVLTTGISSGFAMIDILVRHMSARKAAVFTVFACFCMSGAGFSVLVNTVYGFCGCVGAAVAVGIMVKCRYEMKKREKKRNRKKTV